MILITAAIIVYIYFNRRMTMPVNGKISSGFGNRINPITGIQSFHNGIDIAVPTGTGVKSPSKGIVTSTFSNSIGGNQLIIKHDNGYTTGYAHLDKILVNKGEQVKKHQQIALTGSTGKVTGQHLHLTVKDAAGNYLDPQKTMI